MRINLGALELIELGRGKSKFLPKPKPGSLKGWSKSKNAQSRHRELKKAVKARGCGKVIGSLTLLRNLSADRATKKAAKKDAAWLHGQQFCKLKAK